MSNTNNERLFYVAFTHAESSQAFFRMLQERGKLVEMNEQFDLQCPDGVSRYAIEVEYPLISQLEGMTADFSNHSMQFLVLFRNTRGSKLQFWPPGSKDGLKICEKFTRTQNASPIITAAELLTKQQEIDKPKAPFFPHYPELDPAPWDD